MGTINENLLICGNKETFDKLFSTKDPWNLNCIGEQLRYKIVIDFIKTNFYKPKLKVLEIGCAEGNFTEFLDKEEINTTSIDISEVAIERAKKRNLYNISFISSDMVEFIKHYDISSYDLVLVMECFYYLSNEKRNELLKALSKKINPDSSILLTMPVRKNHTMFLSEQGINDLFGFNGFKRFKKYGEVVLTLKGINGLILQYIPTYFFKRLFISLHRYFFPFRINQKLFVFKKQ